MAIYTESLIVIVAYKNVLPAQKQWVILARVINEKQYIEAIFKKIEEKIDGDFKGIEGSIFFKQSEKPTAKSNIDSVMSEALKMSGHLIIQEL